MSDKHTKQHSITVVDEDAHSNDEGSDSASQDGDHLSLQEGHSTVFVSSSPQGSCFSNDVYSKDLHQFFCSKFRGRQIKYAHVVHKKSMKKTRGYGRVKFTSASVAREAIARLNGCLFLGACKFVRNKRTKKIRGYGRVKFASVSVAREAIARLNGCLFLGTYKLYVGFVREPEIKEVMFQCTSEQLLYYDYCFFDGLSQQVSFLKHALPAKVIKRTSKIFLLGTTQEIESSCEMLNRFLSGLSYRKISYKYDCNHKHILEEDFIPTIMENEITCIFTTERPADLMHVHIFSHKMELLLSTFRKFQVNRRFSLPFQN